MGQRDMDGSTRKGPRKAGGTDGPIRRSNRILSQARPTPGLLAAKKSAQQRMGNAKKQPIFTFVRDIYQTARDAKDMVRLSTGLVYDEKMLEHECLWDKNYPECPQRLAAVISRCNELGLLSQCQAVEPRYATDEEILSVHTQKQLSVLKSTQGCFDSPKLEALSSNYDSIYIHPSTYECSLLAAGSVIELVDQIIKGTIQNGVAFVRPPGHHATKDDYCGYSFFNNVALAAQHGLDKGLKKILIVDWDVHHGQGTQRTFYDNPKVLYFSIHRYEHGRFWPNLRESEFDFVGEGEGRGFNVNVPLNETGMGDADYLAVFHQILLRIAYEFQPELIIVSAGYDAAIGCPEVFETFLMAERGMGEMKVTPACYAHMINSLLSLASGKVAVILEGGYCIKSLAEGAALTLRSLLGAPCPVLGPLPPPTQSIKDTILNVIYAQRELWKCFRYHRLYSMSCEGEEGERYLPTITFEHSEPLPKVFETRNCYPVQSAQEKELINSTLRTIISSTKLLSPPHKVCFIYDSKMMVHQNYEDADHLEKPERISSIFSMHEEYNLMKRLHILKSRLATEEELKYAHSKNHLLEMKNLANMSVKELINKKDIYHSVYLHHDTFNAACIAAGCLLQVVESVLKGESQSGVAVVRPPGHHADIDEPCGFCIFNSVAVAARYATKVYNLKRVLIVDWDVHHGNGTQEIFYEDPNVLYMSVHRYDNGGFFPHTGDGAAGLVGRGPGEGFNVNIPWNKGNMGDGDYVAAFFQVVLPIAYQFDPELVLISAGFDAAEGDPLGGCNVTPECFGHMTHWLSGLADGKVVLSLEGGYNVNSISYSMAMCTKALLGDPLPPLRSPSPCPSAVESIWEAVDAQSYYWPAVSHQRALPAERVLPPQPQTRPKNYTTLVTEGDLLLGLSLSDVAGGRQRAGDDSQQQQGAPPPQDQPGPSRSPNPSAEPATLTDFLISNIQALVNEEMYAVVPLKTCPHLPSVQRVPEEGIDPSTPCSFCQHVPENWICLICFTVGCGRYVNEHMLVHNVETSHPLVLSFSDLSVWCYPCQSYVDNEALYEAKNAVHLSKFGTPLTWSYKKQRTD